jgi:hypothetical protein
LQVLQLAQNNADLTAGQALQSCAPLFELLKSVGSIIEAAGVGGIEVPSINDLTGGELAPAVQVLTDLKQIIDTVIDLLPC